MNISDVIAGIRWIYSNIAIIISMTTAIGAFLKLRKQRELAITLQEKQEKAQKELETYKNELAQQNEKINYTFFLFKNIHNRLTLPDKIFLS